MPLTSCPACQREVQEDQQVCPYCGVVFAKWKPRPAPSHSKSTPEIQEHIKKQLAEPIETQARAKGIFPSNRIWAYGAAAFFLLIAVFSYLHSGTSSNKGTIAPKPSSAPDTPETGLAAEGMRQAAILLPQDTTGTGTGFIVNPNGYILTAAHVVADANNVTVSIGQKSYAAQVLKQDKEHDVALIKINATGLPVLRIGNSTAVARQDSVYVYGFPLPKELGTALTTSSGYITAIQSKEKQSVFQTDARVNPGNSGGPLVNKRGEVIGIVTSKLLVQRSGFTVSEGLNFAVPISYSLSLLADVPDFDFSGIGKEPHDLTAKQIDQSVASTVVLIALRSGQGPDTSTPQATSIKCQRDDTGYDAPFGFCWNMTFSDFMAANIPFETVQKTDVFNLVKIKSAPVKPSETDFILLIFDKDIGLVKMAWFSIPIMSDPYGIKGKETYSQLKNVLIKRFGAPDPSLSREFSGMNLFTGANEFYECLQYKSGLCGVWRTLWSPRKGGSVLLALEGGGRAGGFIKVAYESPRFADSISKKNQSEEQSREKAF